MRPLIDQNLPRSLATRLAFARHDAVHTSDEGLEMATDPVVFAACINQNRILVTGNKKLTKFLAASGALAPTVIIVRGFGRPGRGGGACDNRQPPLGRGDHSGLWQCGVFDGSRPSDSRSATPARRLMVGRICSDEIEL